MAEDGDRMERGQLTGVSEPQHVGTGMHARTPPAAAAGVTLQLPGRFELSARTYRPQMIMLTPLFGSGYTLAGRVLKLLLDIE